MTKKLYLETYAGISGDMFVAAMLDLGAEEEVLRKALDSIPAKGFSYEISRVNKAGISCKDFNVILDEEHENHDHDMAYLFGNRSGSEIHHHHHHEEDHECHCHGEGHEHSHPGHHHGEDHECQCGHHQEEDHECCGHHHEEDHECHCHEEDHHHHHEGDHECHCHGEGHEHKHKEHHCPHHHKHDEAHGHHHHHDDLAVEREIETISEDLHEHCGHHHHHGEDHECHCHGEEHAHGHCGHHHHHGEEQECQCGHHQEEDHECCGHHGENHECHCHGEGHHHDHGEEHHCPHHQEEHHHHHAHEEEHHCPHGHEHTHDYEQDHHHDHGHSHAHGHHHEHRNLEDCYAVIDGTDMTESARDLAKKIFLFIGEAEAKAHNLPLNEVHFHEVGAIDSIADIIAAAVTFDNLGISEVIIPSLYEGQGTIRCQHGILPIPVPATLNIAQEAGIPVKLRDIHGELVTPTGAAIAAAIVTSTKLPAGFTIQKTGLGAGKREYEGSTSMLRAILIEEADNDKVIKLETDIDDTTGEILGYTLERLMEEGALDAHYAPIFMKKNRPAWTLTVLCQEKDKEKLEDIIFKETTTIGIREIPVVRSMLERKLETKETPYGEGTVKTVVHKGKTYHYPEYETAKKLAKENGVSLKEVLEALKKFE